MNETPYSPLDQDPNITFHAVGVALTHWEYFENSLATLHSIFKRKPYLVDAMREFGNENRVTSKRIQMLDQAGKQYFYPNADDRLETRFAGIIKDAEGLSTARHKIAHGVVTSIQVFDPGPNAKPDDLIVAKIMWGVGAPTYAGQTLRKPGDTYMFGSQKIMEYVSDFDQLRVAAYQLAHDLVPPPA